MQAGKAQTQSTIVYSVQLCEKMEFSQTSEETHGQFHSHLLTCGGVKEQEGGKNRKRKRRGHGGGLKRTVRMMQKGNPTGNSRDGTDTGN